MRWSGKERDALWFNEQSGPATNRMGRKQEEETYTAGDDLADSRFRLSGKWLCRVSTYESTHRLSKNAPSDYIVISPGAPPRGKSAGRLHPA